MNMTSHIKKSEGRLDPERLREEGKRQGRGYEA